MRLTRAVVGAEVSLIVGHGQSWVGIPALAPPGFVILASPPLSLTNTVMKIKFSNVVNTAYSMNTISSCYQCHFCLLSHSCPQSLPKRFSFDEMHISNSLPQMNTPETHTPKYVHHSRKFPGVFPQFCVIP